VPKDAWWTEFYKPLKEKMGALLDKYKKDTEALKLLKMLQNEIDIVEKNPSHFNTAFYIMKKHKLFPQNILTIENNTACMTRYNLPSGMQYASLKEREEFYSSEFDLSKVDNWLKQHKGKVKFAVIIGRHTQIYPEKYRDDIATTIIIDDYSSLEDVRGEVLEFLPEAVYYDRTVYGENDEKLGQELAFDLDPENVVCPIHGSLKDKMKRQQGLSFCELELDIVRQEAVDLMEKLENRFSDLAAVYSGRGFHVHVFDPEAYHLNAIERLEVAQEVKHAGFHIDEWVTSGEMRLIRLPFSLNGLVSRIVLPLKKQDLEAFNPLTDERCKPKFLV
jgi:hypothetical protein